VPCPQQGTADAFKATACNRCHNAPPTGDAQQARRDRDGDRELHVDDELLDALTYGFTCGMCHTAVSTNHMDDLGGTADPYLVDVDFNWDAVVYAQGGAATNETHATSGLVPGTNGSCS
jgi:hypothetical protein